MKVVAITQEPSFTVPYFAMTHRKKCVLKVECVCVCVWGVYRTKRAFIDNKVTSFEQHHRAFFPKIQPE